MASSGYTAITFVANEQPTTAKWNLIGSNDASFNTGNGFEDNIIIHRHIGGSAMVVQEAIIEEKTMQTTTALIPYDDTIPQSSEGAQIMSGTFTPKSATNRLIVEADIQIYNGSTTTQNMGAALFKDSDSNAFAANTTPAAGAGVTYGMPLRVTGSFIAGTTSAITFKARIGLQISGTLTVNGIGGGRFFGGVMASRIKITEVKP